MAAVWTVAKLTVWEASRRKLLIALVILTAVIIALSGWGFHEITTITRDGQPLPDAEIKTVAFGLLLMLTFMYSAVLALSASAVAAPSLAGEIESGQILAVLARPVRRDEVLLGKWLGFLFLIFVYAAVSGFSEMLVVAVATGFQVPHPIEVVAFIFAEGVILLTLALALSTRMSGITGAIIALAAYFMAWVGGVVGNIGQALGNSSVETVGTVSRVLLPTDGLWHGAIYYMEPATVILGLRGGGPGAASFPFSSPYPPGGWYLAWAFVWIAGVLALSIWSFRRREV